MLSQYPEIYILLVSAGWLAFAAVFYCLLRKIVKDIGHGAPDFLRILVSEFRSLKNLKLSDPGALNALAILAVFLVAVLTIAALEVEKIFKILVDLVGQKGAEVHSSSASFLTVLVITAVLSFVSVYAVSKFEKIGSE